MADRFPSLDDFDSGGRRIVESISSSVTDIQGLAQTVAKDATDSNEQDFLAREKALLGDDAEQFATNDDAAALAEPTGDLLDEANAPSTFESQFPDLGDPSSVRNSKWHLRNT